VAIRLVPVVAKRLIRNALTQIDYEFKKEMEMTERL